MRAILLSLFIFYTVPLNAQIETPDAGQTVESAQQSDSAVTEQPVEAQPARLYSAQVHWSPLSTWIPSKKGLALGYRPHEKWLLEAEYTSGSLSANFWSLEFGGLTDRRYGIQGRYFPGKGGFHWILGLFKSEFEAELGATLISGTPLSSTNVWSFESFGPQLGIAHRWKWDSGFTWGMDWLVIYTPLFGRTDDSALRNVQNPEDRSDLDRVLGNVRKFPQFEILKINLGYQF